MRVVARRRVGVGRRGAILRVVGSKEGWNARGQGRCRDFGRRGDIMVSFGSRSEGECLRNIISIIGGPYLFSARRVVVAGDLEM
jgi:hypothetical protein